MAAAETTRKSLQPQRINLSLTARYGGCEAAVAHVRAHWHLTCVWSCCVSHPSFVPASSWKVWEGVRELVQNWHDGVLQTHTSVVDAMCTANPGLLRAVRRGDSPQVAFASQVTPPHSGTPTETPATPPSPPELSQPPLFVRASVAGRELGWLQYLPEEQMLVMVNREVGLSRKVLLLGYSSKAKHRDVIGYVGRCEFGLC